MKEQQCQFLNDEITVRSFNTIVVGTGAAGYNAADRLFQYGQEDIAIVTENVRAGTSRNTGSDKQTYYKLSLSGNEPDSVKNMAEVFFSGKCVDGDHALCEAALSAQCFLRLVELGVPFPHNHYGEYVGYKTDHDPSRRATSVGPYTSKMMTECLEKSVKQKNIPVFDHCQVIRILGDGDNVCGLLCLDLKTYKYEVFSCRNVVFATGGPAGMYAASVYPFGQYGASGLAFEAGAKGKNLTEWQIGLASVKPRWNVSGTYMQVLPRFVSTDAEGKDEREFLTEYFSNREEMLSKVFLKGYQWPFDVRKVLAGSSIIDLLVYQECCIRGRRVFLDYRTNPGGKEIDYEKLDVEAYQYLKQAGACFGTPYERLQHMNMPAIAFYRDRGVDLGSEMLEIAVSVQHNNGGLSVNEWWQTNVGGLFAVGEVSGTHGVYRPGGSALNAGQVGSTRAAQYIAAKRQGEPMEAAKLLEICGKSMAELITMGEEAIASHRDNVRELFTQTVQRMSRVGSAIRNKEEIHKACEEITEELSAFSERVCTDRREKLGLYFRLRDTLLCQYVYLSAMDDYIANGGLSRGSALYTDAAGELPGKSLPELFRFRLDDDSRSDSVQEVEYKDGECRIKWRKVRPIPEEDDFFENVWRQYRENKNIQ